MHFFETVSILLGAVQAGVAEHTLLGVREDVDALPISG